MSIVELYKEEIKSYQGSLGKFIVEKLVFLILLIKFLLNFFLLDIILLFQMIKNIKI